MIKGIITPEERDEINSANYDIVNSEDVIETLENLVLKIKIIQLGKLASKLNNLLNNPTEEVSG